MDGRLGRLAPWAGVLFGVLFGAGFLIAGDNPDTDSAGDEVLRHYVDRDARVYTAVVFIMVAAVALLFFAGYLRRVFSNGNGHGGWLATVAFGGAVIYTVALGIFGMTQIMLIDAADMGDASVARTLNVIDNDNFRPAVIGLCLVLIGVGAAALATKSLPKWFARISLVLGIIALFGPIGFVAFLAFPIWAIVAGVLLGLHPPTPTALGRPEQGFIVG
jgi:hypothetical protein